MVILILYIGLLEDLEAVGAELDAARTVVRQYRETLQIQSVLSEFAPKPSHLCQLFITQSYLYLKVFVKIQEEPAGSGLAISPKTS